MDSGKQDFVQPEQFSQHRVFELVMKDDSNHSFDSKLDKAIQITNLEDDFKFVYLWDCNFRCDHDRHFTILPFR